MTEEPPKAFISYSWSSPGHCDAVRSWAERLVSDGVDILLDQWDLSEGQDKYAFMEKMVADPSVSHVIIFSDEAYAKKADNRKAGVGTESQIISKKIYEKVDQKKFIPVVCEKNADGEPCLPVFLESRIWIDFSTPESLNENWERLLRALFGKPIHEKPALGKPPSYLVADEGRPALPTIGKYNTLRTALLNSKASVPFCRDDFIEAAIGYADELRVRTPPEDIDNFADSVLRDIHTLLPLRDQLVDWLLIETAVTDTSRLQPVLIDFLERMLHLKYKPAELKSWEDRWFDAHRVFVYEMFLYLVASLIERRRDQEVYEVLTAYYTLPDSEACPDRDFVTFSEFWAYSQVLDNRNKRLSPRRISPVADLIKERASRSDLTFADIMQAELLVFLKAILSDAERWYPHTLVYSGRGRSRFPLFVRAAQHKGFTRLRTMTGLDSGDELRTRFKRGYSRHGVEQLSDLTFHANVSFSSILNIDALDTIR